MSLEHDRALLGDDVGRESDPPGGARGRDVARLRGDLIFQGERVETRQRHIILGIHGVGRDDCPIEACQRDPAALGRQHRLDARTGNEVILER